MVYIHGPATELSADPDPAEDAPLGAAGLEDVGYPPGADLDDFGRCKLAGDPDALIHDPVALDRAWRLIREEDLGQFGGYTDSPDGKAAFERDWKAALDQRVDLVDTLSVARWRENQQRARFEQRVANEARAKVQAKAASKSAALKMVATWRSTRRPWQSMTRSTDIWTASTRWRLHSRPTSGPGRSSASPSAHTRGASGRSGDRVPGAGTLAERSEAAARARCAHGLNVLDQQLAGLVALRNLERRCDPDAAELLTAQIDGLLQVRSVYTAVIGAEVP
jgi:hypothetical protein